MSYRPGPPPKDWPAVERELWRISQNIGEATSTPQTFIYVGDYSGTASQKWQQAIDEASCFDLVVGEPNTIYEIDTEVAITEKPVRLDLNYSTWIPAEGYTGYLLSVNGCRRGQPDLYWHHPCLQDLPAYLTREYKHWPQVKNGIFSGYFRDRPCGGIIFRGGNSDVVLGDLFLVDIAGTAIAACDPDSSTGLDAENQYIQESLFHDLHIKNCGATGKPSLLIGRNANGTSNHNNLRVRRSSVIYSRDSIAIQVINKNPVTANGRIQSLQFSQVFVHGNRSLLDPDSKGETAAAENDLIVIGQSGITGTEKRIREVSFTGCRLIEQEDGYAAIHIKQDTDVIFNGDYVASASGRAGFKLSDAGAVLIQNDHGFDGEDHIVVDGEFRFSGHQLIIGNNCHISPASMDGPNIDLGPSSWERVKDMTADYLTYLYPGDDALGLTAGDNFDPVLIGDSRDIDVLNEITVMPQADLTAAFANYAKLVFKFYNEDGSLRSTDTITVTTRATANGGTGDWTARNRVDCPVPEFHLVPAAISFEIQKVGTGVLVPPFVLRMRLSQSLIEKKS